MTIRRILLVSSVACVWLACGPTTQGESIAANSAAVQGHDDGTSLSATTALTGVTCEQAGGAAAFAGAVTTTGSVDSVDITAQVDGGARQLLLSLLPQDFTHDGRIKTASYAVSVTGLADGTHSLVLCFTQSGAQGREPKEYCAAAISVTAACTSACSGAEPFGDLVGNPSLCTGNGPPHIPVHVKGDFGEAPALHIAGPNGYALDAAMNHAGDSCVYQYNWDTAGNGGAGTYAFTVTGNGHVLNFSAALKCR